MSEPEPPERPRPLDLLWTIVRYALAFLIMALAHGTAATLWRP